MDYEYKIGNKNINYLIKVIDMHDGVILRKNKIVIYTMLEKEISNKVLLEDQTVNFVVIEYALFLNSIVLWTSKILVLNCAKE